MARGRSLVTKRIYEAPAPEDGLRYLVDRIWPRGIKKSDAQIDGWLRDLAPSTGLRRWFGHDPERWQAFVARYGRELDGHEALWRPILEAARRQTVTLLYAARDPHHNNAVALEGYLERRRTS